MMKEFAVEFECQHENFDDDDDGFTEPYFDFRFLEIEQPETIGTLLDYIDNLGRIYVAPESEHIFEPKEGDKGIERKLHSQDLCFYGGKYWAYENEEMQKIPHQARVAIIMRDNQQFFEAEVENER
jgi:hypothetical protein